VEKFVESIWKAAGKKPGGGLVNSSPNLIEFVTLFLSILIHGGIPWAAG
jgi:hypothetical protein